MIGLLLVLATLPALARAAGRGRYRLELDLEYDSFSGRPYTYVEMLEAREGRDLLFDPSKNIKPYLREARKKLAKKEGYSPELYGERYYQYVTIKGYTVRMEDTRTGRWVIGEEPRRRR